MARRRHHYRLPAHWRALEVPQPRERRLWRALILMWIAAFLYVSWWFFRHSPEPRPKYIDHELADPARLGFPENL